VAETGGNNRRGRVHNLTSEVRDLSLPCLKNIVPENLTPLQHVHSSVKNLFPISLLPNSIISSKLESFDTGSSDFRIRSGYQIPFVSIPTQKRTPYPPKLGDEEKRLVDQEIQGMLAKQAVELRVSKFNLPGSKGRFRI